MIGSSSNSFGLVELGWFLKARVWRLVGWDPPMCGHVTATTRSLSYAKPAGESYPHLPPT